MHETALCLRFIGIYPILAEVLRKIVMFSSLVASRHVNFNPLNYLGGVKIAENSRMSSLCIWQLIWDFPGKPEFFRAKIPVKSVTTSSLVLRVKYIKQNNLLR